MIIIAEQFDSVCITALRQVWQDIFPLRKQMGN